MQQTTVARSYPDSDRVGGNQQKLPQRTTSTTAYMFPQQMSKPPIRTMLTSQVGEAPSQKFTAAFVSLNGCHRRAVVGGCGTRKPVGDIGQHQNQTPQKNDPLSGNL